MTINFIITINLICCVTNAFVLAQGRVQPEKNNIEVENLIAQASNALVANDLGLARNILQKILAQNPRNVAAQTLSGAIAERENNLAEAEKHFALAAKISPKTAETRNNYGAILLKLNKKTEAVAEIEASLRLNPSQSNALVNLAQIRFNESKFSEARELFDKAFKIAPDAAIARALIIIDLQIKDANNATEDYKRFTALTVNAEIPVAMRVELGAALLESGLNAEAVAEFLAAVALDSSNAENLVLLSRAYLQQKDVKSAGRTLESAVARGVDDPRIYAALADVYQAGGFIENAIPAMRIAIEKNPKSEFYRVRYGLLLIDSKAPAAAVIRLNEAVKDFPRSARLYLALAIAQQADGKSVDAQNSLQRALEIDAKSVPVLAYLALIYDEKGEYQQAAATTERALAIEEKNAVMHFLLADTLLETANGDLTKIETHLKRAIELDDNLSQAHLSLGRVYARTGRWNEAATEFQQAVKLEPEVADAYYQLGRALVRLKRNDESRAAFDKFKALNETQTARTESTRKDLVRRLANTRF